MNPRFQPSGGASAGFSGGPSGMPSQQMPVFSSPSQQVPVYSAAPAQPVYTAPSHYSSGGPAMFSTQRPVYQYRVEDDVCRNCVIL